MRDEYLEPVLASEREVSEEAGLRPRHLDEFVGQRELKEHLDIVLGAAKQRGQAADVICRVPTLLRSTKNNVAMFF